MQSNEQVIVDPKTTNGVPPLSPVPPVTEYAIIAVNLGTIGDNALSIVDRELSMWVVVSEEDNCLLSHSSGNASMVAELMRIVSLTFAVLAFCLCSKRALGPG